MQVPFALCGGQPSGCPRQVVCCLRPLDCPPSLHPRGTESDPAPSLPDEPGLWAAENGRPVASERGKGIVASRRPVVMFVVSEHIRDRADQQRRGMQQSRVRLVRDARPRRLALPPCALPLPTSLGQLQHDLLHDWGELARSRRRETSVSWRMRVLIPASAGDWGEFVDARVVPPARWTCVHRSTTGSAPNSRPALPRTARPGICTALTTIHANCLPSREALLLAGLKHRPRRSVPESE